MTQLQVPQIGFIRKLSFCKASSKFFFFNGIPFNAIDSGPYYQFMIDTIAKAGPGIKGLTGYQIGNAYL